jgi:hypothetical protein
MADHSGSEYNKVYSRVPMGKSIQSDARINDATDMVDYHACIARCSDRQIFSVSAPRASLYLDFGEGRHFQLELLFRIILFASTMIQALRLCGCVDLPQA